MRGIVKELRFEKELTAIEPDARRADEFVEAAEWALGRDPTQGWRLGSGSDSSVWFLPMSDVPDAPRLDLYYTFDEERVYFLSIQIAP